MPTPALTFVLTFIAGLSSLQKLPASDENVAGQRRRLTLGIDARTRACFYFSLNLHVPLLSSRIRRVPKTEQRSPDPDRLRVSWKSSATIVPTIPINRGQRRAVVCPLAFELTKALARFETLRIWICPRTHCEFWIDALPNARLPVPNSERSNSLTSLCSLCVVCASAVSLSVR